MTQMSLLGGANPLLPSYAKGPRNVLHQRRRNSASPPLDSCISSALRPRCVFLRDRFVGGDSPLAICIHIYRSPPPPYRTNFDTVITLIETCRCPLSRNFEVLVTAESTSVSGDERATRKSASRRGVRRKEREKNQMENGTAMCPTLFRKWNLGKWGSRARDVTLLLPDVNPQHPRCDVASLLNLYKFQRMELYRIYQLLVLYSRSLLLSFLHRRSSSIQLDKKAPALLFNKQYFSTENIDASSRR